MSHLGFFAMPMCFIMVVKLSIASIPEDGKDPEVICLTVDHSNVITTSKTAEPTENRALIVVKGPDQRKCFKKLGLFTINLEMLPHFRELNDRTLPDHLHNEEQEDYDISECTLVKSYRFVRYLQHFNKLQAECKKQTAHLVEEVSETKFISKKGGSSRLGPPFFKTHNMPTLEGFKTLSRHAPANRNHFT
ncbi:hypothetical protein TNCV_3001461 [Trichonephila clavipes]|nr:hypothetical protein TNCV_3001461 [Trichonephila clavipes]